MSSFASCLGQLLEDGHDALSYVGDVLLGDPLRVQNLFVPPGDLDDVVLVGQQFVHNLGERVDRLSVLLLGLGGLDPISHSGDGVAHADICELDAKLGDLRVEGHVISPSRDGWAARVRQIGRAHV